MKSLIFLFMIVSLRLFGADNDFSKSPERISSLKELSGFYVLATEKRPLYRRAFLDHLMKTGWKESDPEIQNEVVDIFSRWYLSSDNKILHKLTEKAKSSLSTFGSAFSDRKKRGYFAKHENELIDLNDGDIIIERALLLTHGESLADGFFSSLILDLMASELLYSLPESISETEKVHALVNYLFLEKRYRFPPLSDYEDVISRYTLLPTVLDKRQGVCLGVSLVCLSLADKLGLPLSVFTPPGHIFLSYRKDIKPINIETTARGIHVDDKRYQSLDAPILKQRTRKETIGLSHFNEAGEYLKHKEFEKAKASYKKSYTYLPKETLVKELYAISLLLCGEENEGLSLLKEIPKDEISPLADDLKENRVGKEVVPLLFSSCKEERKDKKKRQAALEKLLELYPESSCLLLSLGEIHLELKQIKEGEKYLTLYTKKEEKPLSVKAVLLELAARRKNYELAWKYYEDLQSPFIGKELPEILKKVRSTLQRKYPKPFINGKPS